MSDLISRSKVIAVLEQLEEHSLSGKMDISNAIYLLEIQPTAYDIDKVVRQLNLESVGSSIQVSLGLLRAIEIVKQGGVSDDVLEENRTNIPANDNSEVTEAYKINWSEMKCASYEELLSFLISNEGNEDLIGKIRVGDICIDVINHPEVEKIFFDFYVLSEDTGYGFSKGIPYSYADDFSISYNDIYVAMKQNQSMMENIEKEIENHIKTFASNQYSLIEHAKRELVIW